MDRSITQVVDQNGYWSVYINGTKVIEKKSYQIASDVVTYWQDFYRDWSEVAEVAENIFPKLEV